MGYSQWMDLGVGTRPGSSRLACVAKHSDSRGDKILVLELADRKQTIAVQQLSRAKSPASDISLPPPTSTTTSGLVGGLCLWPRTASRGLRHQGSPVSLFLVLHDNGVI